MEFDGQVSVVGDAPTRERVARSILENGPSTAAALAERLALTPAAVRRHLDALVDDGSVEAREPRVYGTRGRGRPAKVFALTDAGRDRFDQQYDDLAVDALRFLAETGGDEAVMQFARAGSPTSRRTTRRSSPPDPGTSPAEALAGALTQDGYAASVRQGPVGPQLCQHHCPVAHVADEFPQLCEAETEVISQLLGPTCSVWPPSPTATGSAPRASRPATTTAPTRICVRTREVTP